MSTRVETLILEKQEHTNRIEMYGNNNGNTAHPNTEQTLTQKEK